MIDKNEITRRLQNWIDQMERSGKHVNLDDINRHVGEIMHAQNAAPKPNFNGFSSEQMHMMLYRPLEVKLTAQGYIPPKMVAELYELGSHSCVR